jgi:1-deoxy-D-xylulose-5-phosphate synthase
MYLEKITQSKDVKTLTPEELKLLAAEVRNRIIDVISRNGGHLAPSLGVVDLTLALLKIFSPPRDSVVWDVSHQAYAWKILTGRNDRFDTIRTLGGLSGFCKREESPFDAFGTGHSSTSVSAALGMAAGRDLNRETGHCIAVIGDGALTGGMSFEALNHSGHLQKDKFLVILNDNEMSISKNVGGLQHYMARFLVSKPYNVLKQQVWDLSASLPKGVRSKFIYGAQKLEESLINILAPNIIFEDLGFKYVGPIDGHNIPQMLSIFQRVRDNMVGPVLVHLVTSKGKGYTPAEKDSSLFHGVGPFNAQNGSVVCSGEETWSDVVGSSLCRLAESNDKVVAITAAMTAGTGLTAFEEKYPKRFFDVGIAEQHAVTFAAGLATKGLKPFFAVYSTFLQRALDQVIHDVALQKLPVVFCIDRAGLVGEDGPTHHGAFDLSFLNCVPNLVILAPSNAEELNAMLNWAADYQDGPVAIRYPRGTAFCLGKPIVAFEPGRAEVITRGDKLAILSVGSAFPIAVDLTEILKQKGHNPWLVNVRSIKPLDTALLDELAKSCSRIITLETNALTGGFGSAVRDYLYETGVKVTSFGYPDRFIPHGSISELNEQIGFTPQNISERICALL